MGKEQWSFTNPNTVLRDITIPIELLTELGITINEYLILYSLACVSLSENFEYTTKQLVELEKKGYIKIMSNGICIRYKLNKLFPSGEDPEDIDLFEQWIDHYPTKVTKKTGGTRALSPANTDTILGKKLRKKWNLLFKKDIRLQQKAVDVLEAEVNDKRRSGDLEYMVNAERWLNGGYWEVNDHLLGTEIKDKYDDEDWI